MHPARTYVTEEGGSGIDCDGEEGSGAYSNGAGEEG